MLRDNYVVAWEAWVTFLFAPLMTGLAYGQDKGWIWCRSKKYKIAHSPSKRELNKEGEFGREQKIHVGDKVTTGTYISSFQSSNGLDQKMFTEVLEQRAREQGVPMSEVDPNEVAAICAKRIADQAPKSRAYYRTQANKAITGGHKAPKIGKFTKYSFFLLWSVSFSISSTCHSSLANNILARIHTHIQLQISFSSYPWRCCHVVSLRLSSNRDDARGNPRGEGLS